jgi:hypothetical protein
MATMTSNLAIGLVCYGPEPTLSHWLSRLAADFPKARVQIINNHPTVRVEGALQGHNEQFEFGAYQDLLGLFSKADQVLLLNDTWLSHHATGLWYSLIKQALNTPTPEPLIWGDLRYDGEALEERPHPFLSTWLIWAPNRPAVLAFQSALRATLQQPLPTLSPEYETFLDRWLGGTGFRGWQGPSSPEAQQRKRQCIIWEHRLNLLLLAEGMRMGDLRKFGPIRHSLCRFYDRAMARWVALSRRKSPNLQHHEPTRL